MEVCCGRGDTLNYLITVFQNRNLRGTVYVDRKECRLSWWFEGTGVSGGGSGTIAVSGGEAGTQGSEKKLNPHPT